MSIQEIKDYWQEGNLDEALELIENLETDLLEGKIVKSNILRSKGTYKLALKSVEEALQESRDKQNKLLELEALVSKAYLLMKPDTIKATTSSITDIEKIFDLQNLEFEKYKEITSTLLTIKGGIANATGNLTKALEYYTQSLKLKEELGIKLDTAIVNNKIGIVYYYMGETKFALQYFHKYLDLSLDLHDKYWLAGAFNLLSDVYEIKGELDLALDYCEKGLTIREEIGIELQIAFSFTTLGRIYEAKGNLVTAIENYKKAWQIRKSPEELVDPFFQAETLFRLINASSISQNVDASKNYFKELSQVKTKADNKIVEQVHRLCEAIILKSSKRLVDKAKAQDTLKYIVNEEVLFHEYTKSSYIHLFELLMYELNISGETLVLDEIIQLLSKFTKFAKDQNSYSLLVDIYVIRSKIALIQLKIEKSQKLLTKAQEIAEEKGLRLLSINISNEHDKLLQLLEKWKTRLQEGISISDGMELTEIEQSFQNLINKSGDFDLEPPSETPLSLLVLEENGLLIVSKKFNEGLKLSDELVASFISAIMSFSKEAFQSTVSIQRIIHQDYTILIKTQKNLVFSYIFTGYSYSAMQKLDLFVETLKSQPDLWLSLSKDYYKVSSLTNDKVRKIIDELFVISDSEILAEETKVDISENNVEFEDNFPQELVDHKFLLHPIRLGIIKILNRHFRYPAADLRKIIGVAWGTFNKHVNALIKNDYVLSQNEFIKGQSRQVLYLEPLGRTQYSELSEIVQSIFD